MKAVCLLGSPRTKGNSAILANYFMQTMQQAGVETASFTLNNLSYRGCQACYMCKTKVDHCILEDDLSPVLEAVTKSDILVMATPVYFGHVSGQLKTFFDRTFSFLVPDYHATPYKSRLAPGKKSVFIIARETPTKIVSPMFSLISSFSCSGSVLPKTISSGPAACENREMLPKIRPSSDKSTMWPSRC